MAGDYVIRTHSRAPGSSIEVEANDDFTPAEAMEFGLKLVRTAQEMGVTFEDPKPVPRPRGAS